MKYHEIKNIFCYPILNDTGSNLLPGAQKYLLKNLSFLNKFNILNIRVYDRGSLGPGATKNFNGTTVTIITAARMSLFLNIVNNKDELIIQNFPLAVLTGNQEGDLKKMYSFNLKNINWEKCFISGTPLSFSWLINEGFVIQFQYK